MIDARSSSQPAAFTETGRGGLAAAVLDGTLRCRASGGGAVPFEPTSFDVELLGAVEAAVVRGIPLGVVLTLPGTAAPLLLGATAVVGAIMRRRELGVEVAVASSNLSSRTLYDRLYFRDQRLADFIPRGSIDSSGLAKIVGRPSRDGGGRLHLVSQLARLAGAWTRRLAAIVIDASAAPPIAFARMLREIDRSVPVVYLTADPFDPGLDQLRSAGGVVWGWDTAAIAELAAAPTGRPSGGDRALVAPRELLANAGASEITVLAPESSDLDGALAVLWRALSRLSAAYRTTIDSVYGVRDATRWVWGVYNTLASLPVSAQRYDAQLGASPYSVRMRDSVSMARAYARNVGGDAGQRWYEVADALDEALAAAGQEEKLSHVENWVNERAATNEPGVLVLRNRATVAATTSALEESTHSRARWSEVISVATVADLTAGRAGIADGSELCLTGPLPRARSGLLALPPAAQLRMITAGPFEGHRAERQAIDARSALARIHAETVRDSAPKLGTAASGPRSKTSGTNQVRLRLTGQTIPREVPSTLASLDNPWEPFDVDIVAMLQRTVETTGGSMDDDPRVAAPARVIGSTAASMVEVLSISVQVGDDSAILLSEPNDLITRRRRDAVQRVAAKSLQAGDVIVLVDHAARHDLLTSVTEKLSESPTYAPLAQLVAFWKDRAGRLRASDLTYRDIRGRMGGTSVTSDQAIGNWVRGVVDGPQDPLDVRRFAEAVGDARLLREADRVGWALKTLHIIHRRIGRWLSAQIAGAQLRQDEMVVDAQLGIHVSDLLESVTTHSVVEIDPVTRLAPASAVGLMLSRVDALRVLVRPA